MTTQHHHTHDYGLGRLLGRAFNRILLLAWAWIALVIVICYPWQTLGTLLIVGVLVYVVVMLTKTYRRTHR